MRLAPKTKENLKINWERQGFNDDEIREKERKYDEETAKLLGATVIDDQIILGQDYFPDLGKEDKDIIKAPTDIIQFPGEDEIIQQQRKQEAMFPGEDEIIQLEQRNRLAEQREQDRLQREVTRQAEENAARIAAEQAAAAPPPQLAQPQDGGGGRDYGHQETRSSSGWSSSPFKKGGRIDKSLTGRSRDI